MSNPDHDTPRPTGVYAEIAAERDRQDLKWGQQNHTDGTGQYPEQMDADVARMACQSAAEGGYLDWLHILREEVAEAFAETDPAELRVELVQVAAVAVAWIQAIDRRTRPARTVPRPPSPLLVREIVHAARAQTPPKASPLCGNQAVLPDGSTVTCSKLTKHDSPWHRRGIHSWKLTFGVPKGRANAASVRPSGVGNLLAQIHHLRDALDQIGAQDRSCTCAAIARGVLAKAVPRG